MYFYSLLYYIIKKVYFYKFYGYGIIPYPFYFGSSKYFTFLLCASAYSISDFVELPMYPSTLITKISSTISIFFLCISSNISFVPSAQTSSSPECPNNPTLITIFPSKVNSFYTLINSSLNLVLPHNVITL